MGKFPAPSYAEAVLIPIFDHMKANMFEAMMEMNEAHLLMLAEQGLVNAEECADMLAALRRITNQTITDAVYDGSVEDLFFYIERLLIAELGIDVAGKLHTARSRNDMDLTIYRMVLRKHLLGFHRQLIVLQKTLLHLIDEHKETVMTGYTHTQPAQATTLGHYLLALLDIIQRDTERLESLYARVNCSPMGAAAFATTGFPISRERVKELLGFSRLVENSYDAISGGDYITEAAAVLAVCAINLGRFIQDLLQWATVEFGCIIVDEAYVQISSIMPQKRNPVSLEHSRALLSSVYGEAMGVMTMVHNTPFGDIVDTEDDLQPHLWKAYSRAAQVVALISDVLASLTIDKAILQERVKENFSTVTELADTLVREYRFSFRTAHEIVSKVSKECFQHRMKASQITIGMIERAALEVTGKIYHFDPSILQALDPMHFVRLRSVTGGPAPQEVARMLRKREERYEGQSEWLAEEEKRIEEANAKRTGLVMERLRR
jgi:argininosuccinate lyase